VVIFSKEAAAMKYVLALDQGTTSSRALVIDRSGSVIATAQKEFPQHFPRPGWVEHDPQDIWQSQLDVAREAMARAGASAGDVAALGITNQRETTLLWDRATGAPVGNAIVWQDRRTASLCDDLRNAGHEKLFRRKTGLVLDAYFSGTKIRWMLDNLPGVRERAERGEIAFGTVDAWLLWKLSGGTLHMTDASNASRTLLLNIRNGSWDEELLAAMGVPPAVLPEVRPSSGVFGKTAEDLFGRPIPVAGMAGDQQSALFAQMCLDPGMAKNTYGTGCFMLMNTGDKPTASRNKLLTTVAWRFGRKRTFALEGSVFVAGAVVQWLRDGLGIIKSAADIEPLATSVPDSGGVVLVPAFAGLGAPHWDPHARGTIVGITRGTTAAHIARAAVESIALQVAEVLAAMTADAKIPFKELRVDGGAAVNNALMQLQADLLGVPVVRPKNTETTAMGAAYLAGLATGFWSGVDEIKAQWQRDRTFEPTMATDRRDALMAGWLRALERAKKWAE
jgi:glycerol kinase